MSTTSAPRTPPAPPGGPWLFPPDPPDAPGPPVARGLPGLPGFPGPAGSRPAAAAYEVSAARPPGPAEGLPHAVLFDRDGTLIEDVPYNGDPRLVRPMPHARTAVDTVRSWGVPVAVVSNQSGVARGLLDHQQVRAVQRRVEELLGPFALWAVCPHGPGDGCACRKPAPGLIHAACHRLRTDPRQAAVIGDIGSDLAAARAAGARGVLVPTALTRPQESAAAGEKAPDLLAAVRLLLPGGQGAR
ncbi:D-glycero-alpha-D-manno-heptose-1,7-bisphosphate 7-phosphatase [Streptomyces syringium]|uniref:D-glycero-alpha-D-manno-heptose-1,7-bisphosphate 7-phosphatase n=1 Tax=Streptomyces syringium TaxID=76729 RepID=UPI0034090B62